jgi:subtilisin-like proprotein convertase family protein
MGYRYLLFAPLLAPLLTPAQTFTTSGGAIPDDGTAVEFPIAVSGLVPTTIDTAAFGLETVCVNIEHTWISDLELRIIAPDGTSALLFGGLGGDTDFFTNTCVNASASQAITDAGSPYTGVFRPQGQMGLVNDGQPGDGTWKLRILDTYAFADAGTLLGASITFGSDPAGYYSITESDLPIVVINTNGTEIMNEPKVMATMGIIDNGPGNMNHTGDPFNDYDDHIGIEIRGNSSTMFQKKSYGFELWDNTGDEITEPLLGMPSESDWILSASYSDKSLLNNPLTFDLAQRMGRYAPRWRHVEVLLNGAYIGVYALMEKIKRDGDRVDIAKLQPQDTIGDDLTGGYIFKLDWSQGSNAAYWTSEFDPPNASGDQTVEFLVDYPNEPLPQQTAYIESYTDSFEYALHDNDLLDTVTGYRHFMDVSSAIDFFLVNEFARNVDGYRLSTFLYKDKDSNGGKLTFGPLWDFDLAFANANYCDGSTVEGWCYLFADVCNGDGKLPPFWWNRFMEDPVFTDSLRCRWENLRDNVFSIPRLDAWCDSMSSLLAIGQQHNFTLYPILGTWVWPNPEPLPTSYTGEIDEIKNWMHARWQWLDDNIPGHCADVGIVEQRNTPAPIAFPNPFIDRIDVRLDGHKTITGCALLDALGSEMPVRWRSTGEGTRLSITPVGALPQGLYVLRIRRGDGVVNLPVVRSAP